jgi:hypothetical protein
VSLSLCREPALIALGIEDVYRDVSMACGSRHRAQLTAQAAIPVPLATAFASLVVRLGKTTPSGGIFVQSSGVHPMWTDVAPRPW